MNTKDWVLSGLWANALFVAIALAVVGLDTFLSLNSALVFSMITASAESMGVTVAMFILSSVGGVAMHGRFTAHLTKSK